jgi:zinc transport system ATP-binding protein
MSLEAEKILEVEDLSVEINGNDILEEINFTVNSGEMIAIIGPNGSGKSTLFKALLGLVPYTGSVQWEKKDEIGYVPQRINIEDIPLSVSDFLKIKKADNIDEALQSVELKSKEIVNKQLRVLSGGELQRVFIAWAVIDEPDILLFDEPTSGVDIGSEEIVYDMLHRLQITRGITILLISHDLHIVEQYADKVLAINKKQLYYGDKSGLDKPDIIKMIFGDSAILWKNYEGTSG